MYSVVQSVDPMHDKMRKVSFEKLKMKNIGKMVQL